jgi:flap endonuclease-1
MGIKGLAKLLSDEAPDCIREVPLSSLQGRKIAVDASMAIYQFLIAVRSGGPNQQATMLTNADGETTSHIQGIFNRTIRFIVEGIRPVYVFDGKPPQFKSGELLKRREKRLKAEEALKAAEETGDFEEQDKQSKRLVRAGTKENEDCIRLLDLMGVPVIRAPCEAEAQAAALARAGKVYATATEDMDALTFRTPVQVRKMTFANAKNSDVQQIDYAKAIAGLGLDHDQFVDLCILLGCDYCETIRGIGPKTALRLVREHGNIETILKNINREKHVVPESYEPNEARKRQKAVEGKKEEDERDTEDEDGDANVARAKSDKDDDDDDDDEIIPVYVEARRLFNNHEVLPDSEIDLKWKDCQPVPLKTFLVDEMGFNPDRVQSSIEKLQKAFKATAKPQSRMDSFFTVKSNPENDAKKAAKRKAEADAAKGKGKKGGKKAAGGGGFNRKK